MKLKCVRADNDWFVEGRVYYVVQEREGLYGVVDEDSVLSYISVYNLTESFVAHENRFKLVDSYGNDYNTVVENSQTEDYTSTPDEDEAFQKLEEDLKNAPLAGMALHIHEIQKWMKESGCDEEMELKIGLEYVNISPFPELTYEAQEGGVGTLIDYMKHSGAALKCVAKMRDVG